jgi:membrane protein
MGGFNNIYYSSQILLFGAEFTQVYADRAGREVQPDQHAVRIEQKRSRKPVRCATGVLG